MGRSSAPIRREAPMATALLSTLARDSRTNFGVPVLPDVDRSRVRSGCMGTATAVSIPETERGLRDRSEIVSRMSAPGWRYGGFHNQFGCVDIHQALFKTEVESLVEQGDGMTGFDSAQICQHCGDIVIAIQENQLLVRCAKSGGKLIHRLGKLRHGPGAPGAKIAYCNPVVGLRVGADQKH